MIDIKKLDLMGIKASYMRNILRQKDGADFSDVELNYLSEDLKLTVEEVNELIKKVKEG